MTYTPITQGTLNWDVPVNAALVDQNARIDVNSAGIVANSSRVSSLEVASGLRPASVGWLAWNYDNHVATGSSVLTTGALHMIRLDIPSTSTISNAIYTIMTIGATLTAGQNLVGLYDASGTLLTSTADQSGNWTSLGLKTTAFAPAVSAAAGTYYLGFLSNGTTPMSLQRTTGSVAQASVINLGQPVATARWTSSGAGLTALPASVTMSGRTLGGGATWAALS